MIYSSSILFSFVRCVRFSPGSKYLAIVFGDGTVQIHDGNGGAKQWYDQMILRYIRLLILRYLSGLYADRSSRNCIHSVCFSPNSDYLATAEEDGQITVSYRFFAMLSRLAMTHCICFCNNWHSIHIKTRFGISRASGYTHPLNAPKTKLNRLTTRRMVNSLSPVPTMARHEFGIWAPTAIRFLKLR